MLSVFGELRISMVSLLNKPISELCVSVIKLYFVFYFLFRFKLFDEREWQRFTLIQLLLVLTHNKLFIPYLIYNIQEIFNPLTLA